MSAPLNFKEMVMNWKTGGPNIFCSAPAGKKMPEPLSLGVYLMAKVIPQMESRGETRFAWDFPGWDLLCLTEDHWRQTRALKAFKNLKCDSGDSTYYYDFKSGDKMRRATIRTEIWYDPEKDMPLSPLAILFGQYMGNGYHFAAVEFSDAPSAAE